MQRFTPSSSSTISIERLGDYSDGVTVVLEEFPSLAHLAAPWRVFATKCDAAEARKKAARRRLRRARVRYEVNDVEFDNVVKALSSEAYHIAGKDASAEPYASLFGTQPAADVVELGEAKATAFGRNCGRVADAVLGFVASDSARGTIKALLDALATQTQNLTAAGDEREDATTGLSAFDIERRQLIREAIILVGDTELGILTAHRGRRDLVDRVLALDHDDTRKAKKKPTEPEPEPE